MNLFSDISGGGDLFFFAYRKDNCFETLILYFGVGGPVIIVSHVTK